jgi:hypothetical protein
MRSSRTLLPLALVALTACSPAQVAAWRAWHHRDPQEAESWAIHECGELCTDDWDHDGVVEPEPSADSNSSTVSDQDPYDGDTPDEDFPTIENTPCEQWSDVALAAGWTEAQWREPVARIMYAESRCDPGAYNGASGVTGLMQIHPLWWNSGASKCSGDRYDPYSNLLCAHYVYEQQGFGAWVTY